MSGYWLSWPKEFAQRDPEALLKLQQESRDDLEVEQAIQFAFDEQWKALRSYCAERNIRFIGQPYMYRGEYVMRCFDRLGRHAFCRVNRRMASSRVRCWPGLTWSPNELMPVTA